MNHDSDTNIRKPGFQVLGCGMQITQMCAFCDKPKTAPGSKRVGPLKLFCCADCQAKRERAK